MFIFQEMCLPVDLHFWRRAGIRLHCFTQLWMGDLLQTMLMSKLADRRIPWSSRLHGIPGPLLLINQQRLRPLSTAALFAHPPLTAVFFQAPDQLSQVFERLIVIGKDGPASIQR